MNEYDDMGNTVLPFPIAAGYRDKPLSTVNVNINPGDPTKPIYKECRTYPAFPWALCEFNQHGDGHDSEFIPVTEEADDHSRDNPQKFWDLCQATGAVPNPIHARPIPGKMDYEQL